MKWKHRTFLASVALAVLLYSVSPVWAQTSMGTAEDFAVLGGSTVTNTGDTVLTGDLGVWPGLEITGFPPGTVTGTTHAGDAVAQQAQSDLTTAYNALAGLACNTDLTGQDLGGLTLTPGVYCFSSSAALTGTLTLDAQDDPDAEFIFQIGSTLTTASNSQVQVINGSAGQECNVFWQVGSSATLGTATSFVGNVLALTSITLNTGASVSGRALARNGAVTLDTNNVAVCPACPPITLSPETLPNGTVGTAYSETITASGGTAPHTFGIISGSLPPGLALSSGGVISGTPTTTGSFTFTVQATDSDGCFGSQIYTIVINAVATCPTIELSPSTLPLATIGIAYNETITATGGAEPHTFSVTSGSLPPGLALSSAGVISGTPTAEGSFTFTVTAEDADSCLGSQIYTLLVNCPAITISPTTLPSATPGVPYSQQLTASGGTAPHTFSVTSGALPAGVTLSPSGLLSGEPESLGTSTFTITATDADGCTGSQSYTLESLTTRPIPTLSEWGLILLTGLLILAGYLTLMRSGRMQSGH